MKSLEILSKKNFTLPISRFFIILHIPPMALEIII
jgi:hypothetical protein